ncbi:isochorismatase family protein [Kosakonia quasisacchari]|uniref:Isochorismatase family protein n=1 Tax=Kosakonia quasisacchari TaxID=2529380 RepID=A0A4V2LX21_9ENTR|nr:isochorismatase family protein [Kosakonia quasisacchari]TCB98685.1 isochorismatase family protein [Kosakonia quasisacchari]
MALTELDLLPALIVIDLQKGIIGAPYNASVSAVVENGAALIKAFRQRHLPVVLVSVAGIPPGRRDDRRSLPDTLPEDFTDFITEIAPQPSDIIVTKYSWGAFSTTELESRLKSLGVTQVIITGVSTGTGVEATARQAWDCGFNVVLPLDAMTDNRPEAHNWSVQNIFPRLGETARAADILTELENRKNK